MFMLRFQTDENESVSLSAASLNSIRLLTARISQTEIGNSPLDRQKLSHGCYANRCTGIGPIQAANSSCRIAFSTRNFFHSILIVWCDFYLRPGWHSPPG